MTANPQRRRFLQMGLASLVVPLVPAAVLAKPVLRFAATGQTVVRADLSRHPYDGFLDLAARLGRSDVVLTQLEMALTGPQADAPTRLDELEHTGSPELLRTLKALSVNLVSTAGNHAFDLGTGGIVSTLAGLDAAGLAHAGTGRDRAEAAEAALLRTGSGTVALLAMATGKIRGGGAAAKDHPGVNELRRAEDGGVDEEDAALMLAAFGAAAGKADLVVACHHNHDWADDPTLPPAWLENWARRCIDGGAGLFVGHGHPALQGVEIYRGRPILYNLGSLFFQTRTAPGHYKPEAWESVVAEMAFADGRLTGLDLVPLILNEGAEDEAEPVLSRGRPRLATGGPAAAILDRVIGSSNLYGTRFRRDGNQASIMFA